MQFAIYGSGKVKVSARQTDTIPPPLYAMLRYRFVLSFIVIFFLFYFFPRTKKVGGNKSTYLMRDYFQHIPIFSELGACGNSLSQIITSDIAS